MINNASLLAVIPARGGSKGLTHKNIRLLKDKPLLAWTIEAAQKCLEIDRLILSSDDPAIIAVARQWGCEVPFIRPPELAQDHTPAIDVALHALDTLQPNYDYLIWLQPTSPLRTSADISSCVHPCANHQAMSAVTVTISPKSPYWMFHVNDSQNMRPILPGNHTLANRQTLPNVYHLNGAVYVANTSWLKHSKRFIDEHTKACIMPPERSVDIDSEQDLFMAEWLLKSRSG